MTQMKTNHLCHFKVSTFTLDALQEQFAKRYYIVTKKFYKQRMETVECKIKLQLHTDRLQNK